MASETVLPSLCFMNRVTVIGLKGRRTFTGPVLPELVHQHLTDSSYACWGAVPSCFKHRLSVGGHVRWASERRVLEREPIEASDWILLLTLVVVAWYAWETKKIAQASVKQASETRAMAEAALRPVLLQWIEPTAISNKTLVVMYSSVGNGPALDITWCSEPAGETDKRVGMGKGEAKGEVTFPLNESSTLTAIIAEYSDANGRGWQSRLELKKDDGKIQNAGSTYSRAKGRD